MTKNTTVGSETAKKKFHDVGFSFSCEDKITGGYYADLEADCQLFHVCVQVSEIEVSFSPGKGSATTSKQVNDSTMRSSP